MAKRERFHGGSPRRAFYQIADGRAEPVAAPWDAEVGRTGSPETHDQSADGIFM